MSDPFDEMAEAVAPVMPEGGFDLPWDPSEEPLPVQEEAAVAPVAETEDAKVDLDPLGTLVFDKRHQDDFDGLMFIGALTHSFDCYGHEVVIRTLTVDELLKVGMMTKEFVDTLGSDRAYITAIVSMCVETVDGRPLITPMGPKTAVHLEKFRFVRENWYFWTTDLIYQEFRALELRVQELVDAMGESSS